MKMPIKATPYRHQQEAFDFAMQVLGITDGEVMQVSPISKGGKGCALLMEM